MSRRMSRSVGAGVGTWRRRFAVALGAGYPLALLTAWTLLRFSDGSWWLPNFHRSRTSRCRFRRGRHPSFRPPLRQRGDCNRRSLISSAGQFRNRTIRILCSVFR
jgi:hypothetical protein